ncbi:MAG TPA: MBL fold metallo-hydrolase [Streptosporangiaceae bacterium]|nr:MBL fold metallo-hydrolase [Streptosporangiaceae bacterium]
MTGPISRNRLLGSLKEAASWPGADRNTVVTLATSLVAARADAEGFRYFQDLSERNPADATAQALAGFFAVRAGQDVAAAIATLDKAATTDLGLPQYFRGLALAGLLPGAGPSEAGPAAADAGRAGQVVADLEFVLAVRDQFPVVLLRAAYQGLARAYQALGRDEEAAGALQRSGLGPAGADRPPVFTSFSVTARDGIRVSVPRALSPAPDVHVALSYDFGDFAFIQTSAGVVAIDAGISPDRVRAAMADLGLTDQAPVSHLILTHAHLDHTGGSEAVRGPDTQVIASAGFPAEAERQRHWNPPFRYLTGTEIFEDPSARPAFDVQPDRLISERTSVVVGGTEFVLIPVRGGETPDALMVYLPASGLLFTGDVMMPYLGVPFTAEGSPEGLLETLRYIRELAPQQLIQGHTTLTEAFTIEALTGLEPALTELHEFALAKIGENLPLPNILDVGYLPALLRDHPAAVVPYLVTRDDFIARLHHQRTGYWQPDGHGLDPRSAEETAAALDLLAGEKADAFAAAAATLAGQGDLALALDILTPGLLRHPGSRELAELRQAVLVRLMEQRPQLSDPFGFLVYAELAGAELPPVR